MTSRNEACAPPPYTEFTNVYEESQTRSAAEAPIPNEPPPKYEPRSQESYADYQPGYQSVSSQPQIVLINQQFSEIPVRMQCCHCFKQITTTLEYQSGALTWLTAGLLCLFGCWLGCCLFPFCVGQLKDVTHKCPSCHQIIGVFRRLE